MTRKKYKYYFQLITKFIFTVLTAVGFWIFCRTVQMNSCMDPAFYWTVPEQVMHLLAGILLYLVFACAGSYAVQIYDAE